MVDTVVKRFVLIDAPRTKVWSALTQSDLLDKWLTDKADVRPNEGGTFDLESKIEFVTGKHKVLQVVPNEAIVLNFKLHQVDSRLEWNLSDHEKGTRLEITHTVDKDAPVSIHYGDLEGSHLHELWEYAGGLLKTLLEMGEAKCRLPHNLANKNKKIEHELTIEATPSQVFDALTIPEEIKKWNNFTKEPICENRVGGRYSYGWGTGPEVKDGSQEIVEYEKDRKIAYTWVGGERDSVVSWSIEPLPGSSRATKLTLVHSGFSENEDITIGHNLGWGAFMHAMAFAICKGMSAGSWSGSIDRAQSCQPACED